MIGILGVFVIIVLVGSALIPFINEINSSSEEITTYELIDINGNSNLDDVSKVVCSTNTTWALTADGKLYGFGYNTYGQQGDGTTTAVTEFTQRLSDQTIAKVVCCNNTTWVITSETFTENNTSFNLMTVVPFIVLLAVVICLIQIVSKYNE